MIITGLVCGAANGLFGAGGGILAVPMLERDGLETKKAHATSLAIMLPLSIISAFIYYKSGNLNIAEAMKYLPFGLAGVFLGSAIMKRISAATLKQLFALVMMYFGVRMLMR